MTRSERIRAALIRDTSTEGKALFWDFVALDQESKVAVEKLLEIAEQAMPDTFFASDSRVQLAKDFLGK